MGKTLKDGKEVFDGLVVDTYDGRMSGSFPIPASSGVGIGQDNLVTFAVTVRVDGSKFNMKKDLLNRSISFKVQDATILKPSTAKELYDSLNVEVEGVNTGLIESFDETDENEWTEDWTTLGDGAVSSDTTFSEDDSLLAGSFA